MNWKNIKSLFVVADDNSKKESPKKKNPPKKEESSGEGNTIVKSGGKKKETVRVTPASNPTGKVEKGQVKPAFVDHLMKAIEENNLDGIDYLEFKNSLKSLANMPMDENLRFQTALSTIKAVGATEERIFESAQFYLDILSKEEQSFQNAVKRGKSQKVDGELQRIEQLKAQRDEKLKQIEQMKADIDNISKEITVVSEKVTEDQVKIDTKSNHFYASYQFVINQIKSDVNKLKQYTQSNNKTDNKA